MHDIEVTYSTLDPDTVPINERATGGTCEGPEPDDYKQATDVRVTIPRPTPTPRATPMATIEVLACTDEEEDEGEETFRGRTLRRRL